MRSIPLILATPEVRAFLEGRKTTHRLPIAMLEKWRVLAGDPDTYVEHQGVNATGMHVARITTHAPAPRHEFWVNTPIAPDDRIWIREAFAVFDATGTDPQGPNIPVAVFLYRASQDAQGGYDVVLPDGSIARCVPPKYRSPMQLQKAHARLWATVKRVHVERLQSLTPEACAAEGSTSVDAFRKRWDKTHGVRNGWAKNPWVRVVTFERSEAP